MSEQVIYTVGGTVQAGGGIYISREADEELLRLCRAGEFCYVLTARQMGKSSLMVATMERLDAEGIRSVEIDLTQIGTELSGLTAEQWYLGLMDLIVDQLDLDVDYRTWWDGRARLGPTQRLSQFLRQVVLEQVSEPVVIFIDEIDFTLNLDFTDDFFAAIRAMYNARANYPELNRLTFVLLGVATPTDLIKDRTRTPFNIGQGIALQEFSHADAQVLGQGIEAVHPEQGETIFARIFHWTNGHPYLTQKLCLAVAERDDRTWTDEQVDRLVEELFLSEGARGEDNLQFVQSRIQESLQRRKLLGLYRKVYEGREVTDDKRSADQNRLKLFGLVRAEQGLLRVRNEIYRQAFDLNWIKANTPVDWMRRVAVISTLLVLLLGGLFGYYRTYIQPQQTTEARAQAFIDNFRGTTSADVRITSLAGLFELSGYEDRARQLFYEELGPDEQRALFEKADSQAVGTQLVNVAKGLYTELENNEQDNQLLEAMAQPLRELDDSTAVNLATEIEQWVTGRKAYAAGECQQAVDAYSVAISLNEHNPGTYFDRGLAYAALGEPSQALADFETMLSLDEDRQVQVRQAVVSDDQLYAALWNERGAYRTLVALVPTPTNTPTSTATSTPAPTNTPTLTAAPTPTDTPIPPTPAHTPTVTRIPPTPTITMTPVPTPTPALALSPTTEFQYRVAKVGCTPNCGYTGVWGIVYDANGNPVPDLWVQVWSDEWCCGSDQTNIYAPFEILLGPGPRAGHWYVAVYDQDQSTQLSGVVEVYTDSEPCEPGSNGCQWLEIDFVRNIDFVIVQQRILAKEGDKCSPEHNLYIRVIDAGSNPLDGINMKLTWPDGETNVVSGEDGPGRAKFTMFGSYQVRVVSDESGRQYTSKQTRVLDSMNPILEDLIAGGYCEGMSIQECAEQRDLGPGYLCYGHYSYEVVFQRQW